MIEGLGAALGGWKSKIFYEKLRFWASLAQIRHPWLRSKGPPAEILRSDAGNLQISLEKRRLCASMSEIWASLAAVWFAMAEISASRDEMLASPSEICASLAELWACLAEIWPCWAQMCAGLFSLNADIFR